MVYSPSGSEDEDDDDDESQDGDIQGCHTMELSESVGCSVASSSGHGTTSLSAYDTQSAFGDGTPSSDDAPLLSRDSSEQCCSDVSVLTGKDAFKMIKSDHTILPDSTRHHPYGAFLPKEILFSADQPSPQKMRCLDKPKKSPTSDGVYQGPVCATIDTGRSPPMDTRNSPQSQFSNELQGPENKILFLLSRFGQMPEPSEALLTQHCMQTLLDYLSFSLEPNRRCFRLLNRLMWDINCFEANVLQMVPGSLYRQLECGFGPRYDLKPCLHNFHRDNDQQLFTTNDMALHHPTDDNATEYS